MPEAERGLPSVDENDRAEEIVAGELMARRRSDVDLVTEESDDTCRTTEGGREDEADREPDAQGVKRRGAARDADRHADEENMIVDGQDGSRGVQSVSVLGSS